jgi:hypothetical protein
MRHAKGRFQAALFRGPLTGVALFGAALGVWHGLLVDRAETANRSALGSSASHLRHHAARVRAMATRSVLVTKGVRRSSSAER